MTVVNFLCRREKPMMKKKAKTITAVSALAIISLLIVPLHNQSPQEPPVSDTGPDSASLCLDRDKTPPAENKALVSEETAEISTRNPPQDNTPSETDFEPSRPAESTEILTESSAPRDSPTSSPVTSKNTVTATAQEPRMGDTRTVDGQKQVYFLGFGWIDDNDEPNVAIFMDGDGDINKMVGCMD
ncbi:DUF6550 family protein [Marasmitruncus massiliensis]|uniref:DUF6550 family protein n=1 Tax=Marasmitruncus massiliensis TaxID=1944642 RepID=UPI0011AECC4B|nr:DUF6550 family protein [Marasmitruncus massiliensis]